MFFPSQYKKALINKKKNTTIRIGKEMGKYKAGKVYYAKSYKGVDWGIKIKVIKVIPTILNKLTNFGIHKQSLERIKRVGKINPDSEVELIRFKIL